MSRFRDWFFEHVYLPEKRRWAMERAKQVVKANEDATTKLMVEINKIKKAVEDETHEHD